MLWPHQIRFPYRTTILVVGCVLAAAIASAWPGLTATQRPMMLVATFCGVAGGFFTYGLMLLLLRVIPFLCRMTAFFLFYGSIAGLVVFVTQLAHSLLVGARQPAMAEAGTFAFTVAGYFGIAGAAFGTINHPDLSSAFHWPRRSGDRSAEEGNRPAD